MAKATFNNPTEYTDLIGREGQEVEVEAVDPKTYDYNEVGPMFRGTFTGGYQSDFFEDELTFI